MAKTLIGLVASDKGDKTIIVTVTTRKTHPLYKKKYMASKRFAAHDEKNEAGVGDRVQIVEIRPMSATKRFKLDKILERPSLKEVDKQIIADENEPKERPKAKSKQAEANDETEVSK